jgi:hypothetical protein
VCTAPFCENLATCAVYFERCVGILDSALDSEECGLRYTRGNFLTRSLCEREFIMTCRMRHALFSFELLHAEKSTEPSIAKESAIVYTAWCVGV